MSAINDFLSRHGIRIAGNPCISPDFCLDWTALASKALEGKGAPLTHFLQGRFATAQGIWTLLEDRETGDCGWHLQAPDPAAMRNLLEDGVVASQGVIFPATFANLLRLKNLVQEFDPESTLFPTAGGRLSRSTLGVGARFTTLHWPAVEWTMAQLGIGLTANQNSIPRELVYDVDAMLAGTLDTVPFPFIGGSVPEGHQGQSVQGMSHGAVLSKIKTGFHRRRIAWCFNADHQPVGGKFDAREDALVDGCILASYITFDLSPELSRTVSHDDPGAWVRKHIDGSLVASVRARAAGTAGALDEAEFYGILAAVWPAFQKMKRRDEKYRLARERTFTTEEGRSYQRELSIDELPGLTPPATTAVMLAACEALEMKIHFLAPAFGFEKNAPYPDNVRLRRLVEVQWSVCQKFGASLGFHSGSGKSAENYRVLADVTGGCLEIKTSGRYTYEMGRALAQSGNPEDRSLWLDWHRFTLELALLGAFSDDPTERTMARSFVSDSLGVPPVGSDVFASLSSCRAALGALPPSPDNKFWFEYNFLYVLAAGGRAEKSALGDHTPEGYAQRSRFYAISDEARFNYARNVARYLVFLAENTRLAPPDTCAAAGRSLDAYRSLKEMLADIAPRDPVL